QLSAAIAAALSQHPDGALLQSLPRSGSVNAAQILAELGDDRTRFPTNEQLAAEGGVAPVTRESGKHRGVAFRRACNKRPRQALTTFADNSRHGSPWAAAIYAAARRRGCRHPHAIRILARAWIRVLWRCWQDRRPYDVTHHRGAQDPAGDRATVSRRHPRAGGDRGPGHGDGSVSQRPRSGIETKEALPTGL